MPADLAKLLESMNHPDIIVTRKTAEDGITHKKMLRHQCTIGNDIAHPVHSDIYGDMDVEEAVRRAKAGLSTLVPTAIGKEWMVRFETTIRKQYPRWRLSALRRFVCADGRLADMADVFPLHAKNTLTNVLIALDAIETHLSGEIIRNRVGESVEFKDRRMFEL